MPYKDPDKRRAAMRNYMRRKRAQTPPKVRTRPVLTPDEKRAKKKAYYQTHREQILATVKTYATQNPEKVRSHRATYYQEHRAEIRAKQTMTTPEQREKARQRARAYYHANKETEREKRATYNQQYRKSHPEKSQHYWQKRRAYKVAAPINDFTAAQWREMQAAHDHRCVYCGRRAKGHLTQDHLTPLSQGGSHTASNILPACRSCNSKKGAKPVLIPVQPLLL